VFVVSVVVDVVVAAEDVSVVSTRVAGWYIYFQTKNLNLGKFLEGLAKENAGIFYGHLVHFTAIQPFDIFYGHLAYSVVIWNIFLRFGILYQEKYGTLGPHCCCRR
jgi:hypothetical protein